MRDMADITSSPLKGEMEFALSEHGEELVAMYLKTTRRDLDELNRAVVSGSHEEAAKLSHKATGSSAIMGFATLAQILARLEQSAQAKDSGGSGSQFKEALRIYQLLLAFHSSPKTSSVRS